MDILNGEYTFDSKDPIFGHGGKMYNVNHLTKEEINQLIVDGCESFKKGKKAPINPVLPPPEK